MLINRTFIKYVSFDMNSRRVNKENIYLTCIIRYEKTGVGCAEWCKSYSTNIIMSLQNLQAYKQKKCILAKFISSLNQKC